MQVPERLVQGRPKAMLPCSANTTIGLPIPLDRLFVDKGLVGGCCARECVLPCVPRLEKRGLFTAADERNRH